MQFGHKTALWSFFDLIKVPGDVTNYARLNFDSPGAPSGLKRPQNVSLSKSFGGILHLLGFVYSLPALPLFRGALLGCPSLVLSVTRVEPRSEFAARYLAPNEQTPGPIWSRSFHFHGIM